MNDMHDLVGPYLLGSLDETEHVAFEAHLTECQQCQAEVTELEPGLANLASANAVAPPTNLRDRVLSSITEEDPVASSEDRPATGWGRWLLPAAAILVAVFGAFAIFDTDPIDAVLNAPDATTVALATSDAFTGTPPTEARVTFSPGEQSAVLEFDGLVDPTGTNVYEAWLIGADGPVPAGTFTPDSNGRIRIRLDGDAEPGLIVAVTEEPEGGLPAPTGAPLFSAEL